MATKQYTIGSLGPFFYEDTDFDGALVTDGVIRATGAPTNPNDLARLADLPAAPAGYTGTVLIISNVQLVAGVLEAKTIELTFADGQLSSVGVESGWTATPLA
jgi:hypothetical protein